MVQEKDQKIEST